MLLLACSGPWRGLCRQAGLQGLAQQGKAGKKPGPPQERTSFKGEASRLEGRKVATPDTVASLVPPAERKWERAMRRGAHQLSISGEDSRPLPFFKAAVERSAELNPLRQMDDDADRFLTVAAKHLEDGDKPAEVDWEAAMRAVREAENRFPLRYYESEELEEMQAKSITYNLAKVVNESPTLKRLVDLGVEMWRWEEKEGWTDLALALDFDQDVAPRVRLLADHIPASRIGHILTKNAPLLQEDLDHLKTRMNYLFAKKFTGNMVRNILCENPYWLSYTTEEIDSRLGYLQKTFGLTGDEVRGLAVRLSLLVTWGGIPGQIRLNDFTLKEVCGFKDPERKRMLLRYPTLYYQKYEKKLEDMFNLLHTEVGYPHFILRKIPEVLVKDAVLSRPRHQFLQMIKRAQYDPEKPLYVPPGRLVLTSEVEFCSEVAKVPVELYNEFLKTV